MHSLSHHHQSRIAIAAIALATTFWLLLHGYHGLVGDGQIYAFQALARIYPHLASDLYLQNTSQDQFTIFSPIFAWLIGLTDVDQAARLLTLFFTAWLFTASWQLACTLWGRTIAWAAIGAVAIASGDYGGAGVFSINESYLTARLPAEALIMTALAFQFRGCKYRAALIAIAALAVHPLVALPGLIFLLWLNTRPAVGLALCIAGLTMAWIVALMAPLVSLIPRYLPLMDSAWQEIVRQRSQFLFLDLWSARDWELNLRPFACLALSALVLKHESTRRMCFAVSLVGFAGLVLALSGAIRDPIALVVQTQAWRWVWIVVLLSTLTLPALVASIWHDNKVGFLCTVLLVLGWSSSAIYGSALIMLATIVWLARYRISDAEGRVACRIAMLFLLGYVTWLLVGACRLPAVSWNTEHSIDISQILQSPRFRELIAISAVAIWWLLLTVRTTWLTLFVAASLVVVSGLLLPVEFKQLHQIANAKTRDEFVAWARAIPPYSTVQIVPSRDVGAFVWFTLLRPNYLALDQSAGIVFSRATAIEVLRRSQNLLPITDPSWQILRNLRTGASAGHTVNTAIRTLTPLNLRKICADPALGFVISQVDVGFSPLQHTEEGPWKGWNLYDCAQLRSAVCSTCEPTFSKSRQE